MKYKIICGLTAGMSFVCVESAALDLSWTPRARSMMRIDDNIRTASSRQEEALGFDTSGDIAFKAQTDELSSELIPRVNVRRFAVGNNLDAEEYSVTFNNEWRQENYEAGVDFSYARESTLASEATDAGRVDDVKDRDSINIAPTFTYLFSDRLQSQTNFLYSDVAYIDAVGTGLIDYTYLQTSTSLTYAWTPSVQLYGQFLVSNFEVPELASTTRSYSGQGGLRWNWNETLEFSGGVGWIQSQITFHEFIPIFVANPVPHAEFIRTTDEAGSGGPIANVSIIKSFDETKANFNYSREVSPSGRGAQSTSDRIKMSVVHRYSERVNLIFDGLYEMRSAQAGSIPGVITSRDLNRDYYELRTGVRYQLRRAWALNATYRFGHRQSTNVGVSDSATTNSVFLIVDYNGSPNKIFSRF